MHNKKQIALIALFLLAASLWLNTHFYKSNYSISYWLWAGITQSDAPANSELFVYQGVINSRNGKIIYRRLGLYPHPIKSKKLHLVFRLEGYLSNPSEVISIFETTVNRWQRHKIEIAGLQLDFDSPTSKLLFYSNFLKEVRAILPKKYNLSITGLVDWAIDGDKKIIEDIASITDEIVFQLYQGRSTFPNINSYLKYLATYPMPFKIGLLSSEGSKNYIEKLEKNSNFKGVIFFIQKDKNI